MAVFSEYSPRFGILCVAPGLSFSGIEAGSGEVKFGRILVRIVVLSFNFKGRARVPGSSSEEMDFRVASITGWRRAIVFRAIESSLRVNGVWIQLFLLVVNRHTGSFLVPTRRTSGRGNGGGDLVFAQDASMS